MSQASATYLLCDGELLSEPHITISHADRGLLYGDGLFETMRSYEGRVHLLGRHLKRLREAGERLSIPIPSDDRLAGAIAEVIARTARPDGALRLTITRGPGEGIEPSLDPTPTILITSRPLLHTGIISTAEELVLLSPVRMRPELGVAIKSTSYLTSSVCRLELARRGVREGIMLTPDGNVAEGSISNIFALVGGVLQTPSLATGCLAGITRGRVMELAGEIGLQVNDHSPLTPAMITAADECFYTNSIRELVPVGSLEGSPIGAGTRGEITKRLQQAYRTEAPDEHL
jgi:branched-chain amino acid aminotransferase